MLALVSAGRVSADVRIANVDMSEYPFVGLTVVTSEPERQVPRIRENGQAVSNVAAENYGRAKGVVLAIDRSRSMHGQALRDATTAARRFVALKPAHDRIAVVTFSSKTLVAATLSTLTTDADSALRTIEGDRVYGTTLYDAVVLSVHVLAAAKLPGRVIILVTDGQETTSEATLGKAIRVARDAHVLVYPIAIQSAAQRSAPLGELAHRTGGTYYGVRSSSALGSVYASISRQLGRTWRLKYPTAARPGDRIRLGVTEESLGKASTVVRIPGAPRASDSGRPWLLISSALIFLFVVGFLAFATRDLDTVRRLGARARGRDSWS